MSFPYSTPQEVLQSDDLDLLAPLFRQTVQKNVPCAAVYFVGPQVSGDGLPAPWRAGVEVVRSGLQAVKDNGDDPALYLPLWSGEQLCGVAVLVGVEAAQLELPASRLQEKSRILSHQLLLVKGASLDPLTGLGNGRLLIAGVELLLANQQQQKHTLLFLEMVPREKDSDRAVAMIRRNGAALHALIGHLSPPCHLGNGVFGLLWPGVSEEQALPMAERLLQWFKRDQASQAHIGLVQLADDSLDLEQLLEDGWQALRTARGRGPFGLCPYASVAARAAHPLSPPSSAVIKKLQGLWRRQEQFALVEWRADDKKGAFPESQIEATGQAQVLAVDQQHGYVFLPGQTETQAEEWCRSCQLMLAELGVSFSMGVALHPTHTFKKAEVVANCRKALLHTAFFGAATFTIFDGVSLNISGDIYYNEGDMARAVREYQCGLELDPRNVNLLNSLGVTHAQMVRYKKALPLFEQVLDIDRSNFMALCNLGFAHQALGHVDEAISFFEEALLCRDDYYELLLQLGKLYLAQQRFQEAVDVLSKAEKVGPAGVRDVSHGAVHRYLGEALFGLGEARPAMASLQRAVRYNSRDAFSLSLLGFLYSQQGEGQDIARSLCVQAVELDELDWRHWYRLARVELAAGELSQAHKAVQGSVRLGSGQQDNLLLQAELYARSGEKKAARALLKKASKSPVDDHDLQRLEKLLAG